MARRIKSLLKRSMGRYVWQYLAVRRETAVRSSVRYPKSRKLVNMVCQPCDGSGVGKIAMKLCEGCGGSGYC